MFSTDNWLTLCYKSIKIEQRHGCKNMRGQQYYFAEFMLNQMTTYETKKGNSSILSRLHNIFTLYHLNSIHERKEVLEESIRLLSSMKEPKKVKKIVQDRIKADMVKIDEKTDWRDRPVQSVRGIGPTMGNRLAKIGVQTVGQLIHYYPRNHLNYSECTRIKDLKVGELATIWGNVHRVECFSPPRNKRMTILGVTIKDNTGTIKVSWFYQGINYYLKKQYKDRFPVGAPVLMSGQVKYDKYSKKKTLDKPEAEILGDTPLENHQSLNVGRIVPIYPLIEGIQLKWLRKAIKTAIDTYYSRIQDPIPESIRLEHQLLEFKVALKEFHFPTDEHLLDEARKRLVFEELFWPQLSMLYQRKQREIYQESLPFKPAGKLIKQFRKELPFTLTGAQERVYREISQDLAGSAPMSRLVQGDVGSGKTVVGVLALLMAIESGYQGALMAPTEILAEQHFHKLSQWLIPMGIQVELLIGSQRVKARREALAHIASGAAKVVVGTHALIQEGVEYQNLGLAIIDEQHRFGVKQRTALKEKGLNPEVLTMTATPIPRTLALSLYGDLDISTIDELPPGRKPIKTNLIKGSKRKQLWNLMRTEMEAGHQCYIVYPLVEESEKLELKAATVEYLKYKDEIFPDYRVGLLHGKMKGKDKEQIMRQFANHELDILVATTVIEVGVDVPNASVMVIEHAERFGLAQLHQLRGRVGRGADKSYCILLSDKLSEIAQERMEIFTQTNDGFIIAEQDLRLRGPGEFMGTRQSGLPDMLLTNLAKDTSILELARDQARSLIEQDSELTYSRHFLLKNELMRYFSHHPDFLEA